MVANLFCHLVHGYTVGAGDMSFVGIVVPRGEDEYATGGYGVEKTVLRFVVIAEAVVRDTDDRLPCYIITINNAKVLLFC